MEYLITNYYSLNLPFCLETPICLKPIFEGLLILDAKTQQMPRALGREQSTTVNHEMLLFSKQSQMLQLWVSDR